MKTKKKIIGLFIVIISILFVYILLSYYDLWRIVNTSLADRKEQNIRSLFFRDDKEFLDSFKNTQYYRLMMSTNNKDSVNIYFMQFIASYNSVKKDSVELKK